MPPVPLQYRQGCFHQIEYKGICRQQIMPAGMMELEKRLRTADDYSSLLYLRSSPPLIMQPGVLPQLP
jgi:hypothetical protein